MAQSPVLGMLLGAAALFVVGRGRSGGEDRGPEEGFQFETRGFDDFADLPPGFDIPPGLSGGGGGSDLPGAPGEGVFNIPSGDPTLDPGGGFGDGTVDLDPGDGGNVTPPPPGDQFTGGPFVPPDLQGPPIVFNPPPPGDQFTGGPFVPPDLQGPPIIVEPPPDDSPDDSGRLIGPRSGL